MLTQQAAALCWVDRKVVLISDDDKHWRVPRGTIESKDKTPSHRAETQAWEEAGVLGLADSTHIGEFLCSQKGKIYRVEVFEVKRCKVREKWPSVDTTKRKTFTPAEAADKVDEFGLRDILRKLGR